MLGTEADAGPFRQRILVTGGGGFLGSHLKLALQEAGAHQVFALGTGSSTSRKVPISNDSSRACNQRF